MGEKNNGYEVVTEKIGKGKIYKIFMLIILVSFITFLITTISLYNYFIKSDNAKKYMITTSSKEGDEISQKISQYKSVIEKYYLGEVNEDKLKEGAIKGYIEGLGDKYTEYISKDDMKDYMEDTLGNFVGIGIYMVKDENTNLVKVLAPIKDSPAEKAGILAGDLIISVDGVEYNGDDMSVAANKIKGKEGSTVKLKIKRGEETKEFEIKRENIKVNPVEGKIIEGNIGYIEFKSFDEETAKEFKNKYDELVSQGAKSLIIDLRNNGGGIVDEALKIADYFVEKDTELLYEIDKNNKEKIEKAKEDVSINLPTVILANENTASSSEILAGILKELGKVKIVGTKTYGKGVIQSLLTLPDGSGIKITSQEYLLPNKKKINKTGIEPNEEIKLPETVQNVLKVKEEEDTQLKKAIEMLK